MYPQTVNVSSTLEQDLQDYILNQLLFQDQELPLNRDASLIQEGVVDSVGILDLVNHISSTYQIAILPEEVTPDNFDTIHRLAAFIQQKKNLPERPSAIT